MRNSSGWSGKKRSELSNSISTSARFNGARVAEPAKITSGILLPRRLLADCSPKTHRSDSIILLFPLPFGPTIPVIPG